MSADSEDIPKTKRPPGGAALVATGIFCSRVAGLVRERVFAHYFGNSSIADAFKAALRIPNVLQNLFGEGVLSASFIPVYASLKSECNPEAARVASVVATILALTTAVLVLLGVLGAELLVYLIAPGFTGATHELAVHLTRIFFPGMGLLVMSAWCLGVLNSHRRFLLSYIAPVAWNGAIIAAMLVGSNFREGEGLAVIAAWGAVLGSALQLLMQLPAAVSLVGRIRPSLDVSSVHVRTVLRNFFPVLFGRGVVQISAYIDSMIASLLPTGAVAALAYSQSISLLPVSLFGMSVSAAELPAMSASGAAPDMLSKKIKSGGEQIAFFVVPTAVAFVLLGDCIIGVLFETGRFGPRDTFYVWMTLAGSSVGLPSSTQSRLLSSAFYAMKDTKTPLRCSLARVGTAVLLGVLLALWLPRALGVGPGWGLSGLTLGSSLAAFLEYRLLRRALGRRSIRAERSTVIIRFWIFALASGLLALLVLAHFSSGAPASSLAGAAERIGALALFGASYLTLAALSGVPHAVRILRPFRSR